MALDFVPSSDGVIRTSGNVAFVRRNSNIGRITTHASIGLLELADVDVVKLFDLLAFE